MYDIPIIITSYQRIINITALLYYEAFRTAPIPGNPCRPFALFYILYALWQPT
jgi:hypothetical protein